MNNTALPTSLCAKSARAGKLPLTLERHLLDTEEAAETIFRLDSRLGRNWCRFFKLPDPAQFLLNLRIAALFHDLGKANQDFYQAVTKPGGSQQLLRHEHLSALFLHIPAVRSWLGENKRLDLEVLTAAVLSHHLKASGEVSDWKWAQPRTQAKVVALFLQHAEVTAILRRIATIASLEEPPELTQSCWSNDSFWQGVYNNGKRCATDFGRKLCKSEHSDRRALNLAVKAGLIVSDAAASGLVREEHSIRRWIEEVIHSPDLSAEDLARNILEPRGRQIEKKLGAPFQPHPFQARTAKQGSRVLLLAACGVGKTLAGWMWAEAQARECPIGKVIFLYPTRGTATEGFRDYVASAPEEDASLLTGTSSYELEDMQGNPKDDQLKDKQFQLSEADERLFSLGYWPRRYFSATVDQFLGFIEHSYSGMCLLPVLADSAVIIDEVHSFDKQMFKNLVSFLTHFDVPVLCMTATLPPGRRKQLEELGMTVFPTALDREEMADLEKKEGQDRYRLYRLESPQAALEEAVKAYRDRNERVLWVVNTVARCQQIADELGKRLGVSVLVYHSRFKLQDRKDRHAEVIAAFQQMEAPAIAVTTQVCEMSLDLDADVLITEVAPVPSLVQRMGRANRHLARGLDFRARVYHYLPENPMPYTKAELGKASEFLTEIGEKDVSQKVLSEQLERFSLEETQPDGSSRFLDGGYYATPGSFRNEDGYTVPCVLDGDITQCSAQLRSKKERVGFVLNIPYKLVDRQAPRPDWLPPYLSIAKTEHYCPRRGYNPNASTAL